MKIIILANKEDSDTTLIARVTEEGEVFEYVVASHFSADGTWGHGHYFSKESLTDAMFYMYHSELVSKVVSTLEYLDETMDQMMTFEELKNEDDGEYLRTLVTDGLCQ